MSNAVRRIKDLRCGRQPTGRLLRPLDQHSGSFVTFDVPDRWIDDSIAEQVLIPAGPLTRAAL